MIDRHFNVLIVDDDADVLAVSRLALRRVKLYGLPLRIHPANSRAEAEAFLKTHPEGANIAMALIDVVMETDDAGLQLCRFIRETLGNQVTPLVIRTGQAGLAPEKAVIDAYEISGYVNKVEATDTRLYSLIKAGVRSYGMAAYDYFAGQFMYHVVANMRSPARFHRAVQSGLEAVARSPRGPLESLHASHAMISTRFFAGAGELADAGRARAIAADLATQPGQALSPNGDRLVVGASQMLLHIEPTRDNPLPLQSVWTISAPPQPFAVRSLYMATRQLQVLMNLMAG